MERDLLQLEDLKEFKFEDWDGKPFLALCSEFKSGYAQSPLNKQPAQTKQVIGYTTCDGKPVWKTDDGMHWRYVFKYEDNEHFFYKRLTYRQLSRWLGTGKGEFLNIDTRYVSSRAFYPESESDEEVPTKLLVRTWDSEEWVQPTTKILKELK